MFDVSHSKIKLWRRCHKAYEYKYIQRLEKKAKPPPLLKGIILHDLLNARALKKSTEAVFEKYEKEYRKVILAEKEEYGELIPEMRRVFEAYQRWAETDKLEYLAVEEPIQVELAPGIQFIGYIDKIVRDESGLLYVLDHKSSRSLPNEEQRFSDLQLLMYVWGRNLTSSDKASGVIWEHIRTKPPGIPKQLKNGELSVREVETDEFTYRQALKEYKLDPANYQEILTALRKQSSPFFQRVKLPKPPQSMIDQVVKDFQQTAKEVRALGGVSTARNMTKDCSWCPYYALCHAELRGQDADYVRKANYQEREREYGDQEEE